MNSSKYIIFLIAVISVFALAACTYLMETPIPLQFDGNRAFKDLEHQVSLGSRVMGSHAHEQVVKWIVDTNRNLGWEVDLQESNYRGQEIVNIVARREAGEDLPWVIIGAHYDSREFADRDPQVENQTQPVPGANDGASGVAVLLELARVLPTNIMANTWLVFFDAEDNGSLPGGEWILGSRAFVETLEGKPDAVVVVDMIGDSDLNIYIERYSDQNLSQDIWGTATKLGYENQFIPEPKYQIIDDHLPFVQAGIPAVDIIDFDYPYWHTVGDTIDKVSPESLRIVGDVMLTWLVERYGLSP